MVVFRGREKEREGEGRKGERETLQDLEGGRRENGKGRIGGGGGGGGDLGGKIMR